MTSSGFVDLHFHLIPGLDDGPESLGEAVEMLLLAHQSGTRRIVATPHMFLPPFNNNDPVAVRRAFNEFTNRVAELSGRLAFLREMSLDLGAENYLSPEFFEALEKRQIVTMNGGAHLLVEFSSFMPLEQLRVAVDRILHHGYRPILAHVERYPFFQAKPQRLQAFAEAGCVIQINSSSILSRRGDRLRRLSLKLLRTGVVDVIASDAHDSKTRRPNLGLASAALRKRFRQDQINGWLSDEPNRVLSSRCR